MSSSIQAKGWVCPKCKKEKPAIAAKCTCGAWKPGYTPNAAAKKPGQLLKWKCPKCKHEKPATALRCMPCNTYQPGHAPAKPKRLCPDCQKTDLNIGLCSCWVKKETTRRKEMLQSIPPVHVIARIVYDGFRGQIPFNTKHHPIVIPPEQVTIGQLKDIILREVFGRQTRIAPPPKGLMSLFYHDKELMPPTSLLAEDHGFRGTRDGSVAMPKSLNTLGIDTGFISRKFGFDITLYVDQVLTFEVVPSPFQDTAQRGGLNDVTCGGLLAPNNTFSLHFPNKKSLMKEVTAAQAKEQLQLVSGIPIERLHILSASGGESDVQKQDFQVSPSSIRTCADEWLVHVLTLNGKHWKVGIDSTSTLRLLKERIRWSGCRVDDDGHLILGDGKVLPNDREEETIESLCLSDGCVLYVVEEIAAYFQETEERQQPTIPVCSIDKAEHRGITLGQLREVAKAILLRCKREGWTSTNPQHGGKLLQPRQVTLYDVMTHLIRPMTQPHKCSYVELVATKEEDQISSHFVSHWWGESVLNFVACLEQHAYDRNLNDETVYWVCAYAINQHDVGGEIDGDDPKSSPFYKAMHLTKGTVTVLDRGSVTYTRIWCSYEISVVMTDLKSKSPGYLYDIYAMSKQDGTDVVHCPVGLTEGFAAADIYPKNQDGTLDTTKRDFEAKWTLSKSRREAAFPLDSASGALVVQLETASASVEDDKKRILNAIAGNTDNFLSDPPASHESYDKLNVRVRGRFALSSYRTALERHADMKPFRKALADNPETHLVAPFRGCKEFRHEANEFIQSLPVSLVNLKLKYGAIAFQRAEEFATGIGRLKSLVSLAVDLQSSVSLVDASALWNELDQLPHLESLVLDFDDCPCLDRLGGFGQTFQGTHSLKVFLLRCMSRRVSSFTELAEGLQHATNMKKCCLDLNCREVTTMECLGTALGRLPALEELSLNSSNGSATATNDVARGLQSARNLIKLDLRFSGNKYIDSLEAFGGPSGCFGQMTKLRHLSFTCTYTMITKKQVGIFVTGLRLLTNLDVLRLSLSGNAGIRGMEARRLQLAISDGIAGVGILGDALLGKPNLREISLDFSGCKIESIEDLATVLASSTFPQLERFSLCCKSYNVPLLSFPDSVMTSADNMPRLRSLELDFEGSEGVTSIASLVTGLRTFGKGKRFDKLHLNFRRCCLEHSETRELCQTLVDLEVEAQDLSLRLGHNLKEAAIVSNEALSNKLASIAQD